MPKGAEGSANYSPIHSAMLYFNDEEHYFFLCLFFLCISFVLERECGREMCSIFDAWWKDKNLLYKKKISFLPSAHWNSIIYNNSDQWFRYSTKSFRFTRIFFANCFWLWPWLIEGNPCSGILWIILPVEMLYDESTCPVASINMNRTWNNHADENRYHLNYLWKKVRVFLLRGVRRG